MEKNPSDLQYVRESYSLIQASTKNISFNYFYYKNKNKIRHQTTRFC